MRPSHPLTDSLVGTILGDRYQIVRCLGQGSMGVVFEALQQPLKRRCAVKVLLEQLRDNQKLHQRFMREARAVSVLNHPNLVTLYDFGFAPDGRPYLVMEFIEGDLLSARIPYEGMPLSDAVQIIAQSLLGLDHVHRHGIIHRDLKPENIALLPSHGQGPHVKILDFGLAKLTDTDGHVALTMTGEVYGTPYYMSPEQGTGSSQVSETADIYALGVILFELLTGAPPFVGKTPVAIITGHVRSPIPPMVPRAGLEVSPELNELVRRCLAKKPQDRFASARQMLDALIACPEGRLLPVSLLTSLRREDGSTSSGNNPAISRPTTSPAPISPPPAPAPPRPVPPSGPQTAQASPPSVPADSATSTRPMFPNRAAPAPAPASLPLQSPQPPAAPAPVPSAEAPQGAAPPPAPPGLGLSSSKGLLAPPGLLGGGARPPSAINQPRPTTPPQPSPRAQPPSAPPVPAARSAPVPSVAVPSAAVAVAVPAAPPPSLPVQSQSQAAVQTVQIIVQSTPRPLAPGVQTVQPQAALQDLPSLLASLSPGGKLPGFF